MGYITTWNPIEKESILKQTSRLLSLSMGTNMSTKDMCFGNSLLTGTFIVARLRLKICKHFSLRIIKSLQTKGNSAGSIFREYFDQRQYEEIPFLF